MKNQLDAYYLVYEIGGEEKSIKIPNDQIHENPNSELLKKLNISLIEFNTQILPRYKQAEKDDFPKQSPEHKRAVILQGIMTTGYRLRDVDPKTGKITQKVHRIIKG